MCLDATLYNNKKKIKKKINPRFTFYFLTVIKLSLLNNKYESYFWWVGKKSFSVFQSTKKWLLINSFILNHFIAIIYMHRMLTNWRKWFCYPKATSNRGLTMNTECHFRQTSLTTHQQDVCLFMAPLKLSRQLSVNLWIQLIILSK